MEGVQGDIFYSFKSVLENGGVDALFDRNSLQRVKPRLKALEAKAAETGDVPIDFQIAALEKKAKDEEVSDT